MTNSDPASDLDPRVLGLRLLEARKARGLTQQDAAEALGLSRPTYIAVEKGDRLPAPHELIRLAELYGRSLHDLQRRRPPVRDFVPHFRAAASGAAGGGIESAELEGAVALLQRLADDYLELEALLQSPLPRRYPAPYDVRGMDPGEAGEDVATAERNRLGLGDGPVPSLRDLLESDVGLRVFCMDLPSRISGLFIFDEDLGGCIAIQRKHPRGRRLWSLAHEFAHFLIDRYEVEVTVLPSERRTPRRERLADSFARAFLIPAHGLRRRFHDLLRSAGQVTPASILLFADLYGVSFEALVLRLEDLRLLPPGTWQRLRESNLRVKESHQLLGIPNGGGEDLLPRRYQSLAVRAFEAGLLSEGELAASLHTDRVRARGLVQEASTSPALDDQGETAQLVVNLAESIPTLV